MYIVPKKIAPTQGRLFGGFLGLGLFSVSELVAGEGFAPSFSGYEPDV